MSERLQFEFPPETSRAIEDLSRRLHLAPEIVLSKALGLLSVWANAKDSDRILVERPQNGASGREYKIDIDG